LSIFALVTSSWGTCPWDPNDRGICDTMYIEPWPADTIMQGSPPYFVRVPIYVTADIADARDSICAFVIPLCYTRSDPTKYCSLTAYWNTANMSGAGFARSIFRTLGTETSWMKQLYDDPTGPYDWSNKIISLNGTSHFWLSLIPTTQPLFQGGSRVLTSTMTFKLQDSMGICIDTCFWPPSNRLTWVTHPAGAGYAIPKIPRPGTGNPYSFQRCFNFKAVPRDTVFLRGELSNFDLKNFTSQNVNDLHIQMSGITCSDITGYYGGWGYPPTCADISGGVIITWQNYISIPPGEWKHYGVRLRSGAPQHHVMSYQWTVDGNVVGTLPVVEQGWKDTTQGRIRVTVRRPSGSIISSPSPVYVQRKYVHSSVVVPLDSLNPGNSMIESLGWTLVDANPIPLPPGDSLVFEIQSLLGDTAILLRYTVKDSLSSPISEYVNEVEISGTPFIHGDANGDGLIELGDVVNLITYLYKNGPAPNPLEAGDANCDGVTELGDVVYLITYLYKGGPPPPC